MATNIKGENELNYQTNPYFHHTVEAGFSVQFTKLLFSSELSTDKSSSSFAVP